MPQPTDPVSAPSLEHLAITAAEVDLLLVPDERLASVVRAVSGEETIMTPEQAVGASHYSILERVLELTEVFDASISAIQRAVERCVYSWRFHLDPEILAKSSFERQLAAHITMGDWPEASLAASDPLEGDIACVDISAFDLLQESVIPDGVVVIESGESPAMSELQTASDVENIRAARLLLAEFETEEIAFIASGDELAHLEAVLRADGLLGPARGDLRGWPAFLELLEAVTAPGSVQIDQVRQLLGALDIDIRGHDVHEPIIHLEGETAVWLRAIVKEGSSLQVETLAEQFQFRSGSQLTSSTDPITQLGLTGRQPDLDLVKDLRSYLKLWGESDAITDEGIEVLDATTAWGTTRPITIFIEPGTDWIRPPPPSSNDRWLERERHRIAQLLTTGTQRVAIQTGQSRDESLCSWFDVAEEITAQQHTDKATHTINFTPEGRPRRGHDRFTKSQLNRFLNSPRDALFDRLLESPQRRAMTRGIAIHDYADLIIAAPAAIEAIGRDRLRQWILDQLTPLTPERRHPLIETRIEAAMTVVEAYLKDVEFASDSFQGYSSPSWMDNAIADAFEVSIIRTVSEQYFKDDQLGISGVIDLIRSPTHLVDFKTGSPTTIEELIDRGRVSTSKRRFDVQLPLYLASLRRKQPEQPLRMSFLYCNGSLPASISRDPCILALERTVEYDPQPAKRSLVNQRTIDRFATAMPQDHPRPQLIFAIGTESVADIIAGYTVEEDNETTAAELVRAGVESGLDEATAIAGARSLMTATDHRWRTQLFEEDLDDFEGFIETMRERRQRYDEEGYPLGDPIEGHLEFIDIHHDLSPTRGDLA